MAPEAGHFSNLFVENFKAIADFGLTILANNKYWNKKNPNPNRAFIKLIKTSYKPQK